MRDLLLTLHAADDLPARRLRIIAEFRQQLHALCALLRVERARQTQGDQVVDLISAAFRIRGYHLYIRQRPRRAGPGRPSPTYDVNPSVHRAGQPNPLRSPAGAGFGDFGN